jgi:hypothetical protein
VVALERSHDGPPTKQAAHEKYLLEAQKKLQLKSKQTDLKSSHLAALKPCRAHIASSHQMQAEFIEKMLQNNRKKSFCTLLPVKVNLTLDGILDPVN